MPLHAYHLLAAPTATPSDSALSSVYFCGRTTRVRVEDPKEKELMSEVQFITDEKIDELFEKVLRLKKDGDWWRISCQDCHQHAVIPVVYGRQMVREWIGPAGRGPKPSGPCPG